MSEKTIVIIGSNGTIGHAFVDYFSNESSKNTVYAFSRDPKPSHLKNVITAPLDIENESSIKNIAHQHSHLKIDVLILATGILHGTSFGPEKTYQSMDMETVQKVFSVNVVGPAIVLAHLLPLLRKDKQSLAACLSARVGSISDNKLGGWYSYRASKAALNMWIKTTSIELKRRNKNAIIVGLHPGTVDSPLSKPFQSNVPESGLFTAKDAVSKLCKVLDSLEAKDTGNLFAWDGSKISF